LTRVFFSYSHDGEEHKNWVRAAAADLEARGLEVILDQTHLEFGQDIHHFTEAAVKSADFVLLICTPIYKQKADGRQRGVGTETTLITSEIYDGATNKFIAVLRTGDRKESIPDYMKHTLWVDVRTGSIESENWKQLADHMLKKGAADQIGTMVWEALFPYDKDRIYDQPRLPELKRFVDFVETGQTEEGRWYVIRRDPIKNDTATILFRDPVSP
jgi:hypothetical protein